MSSPVVFDPGPLSDMDDPETEAAVATMFLDGAAVALAELEEAITLGDVERLDRVAHRLKGSAASVGAVSMSERCDELCRLARGGTLPAAVEIHERLAGALADTDTALQRYLTRPG